MNAEEKGTGKRKKSSNYAFFHTGGVCHLMKLDGKSIEKIRTSRLHFFGHDNVKLPNLQHPPIGLVIFSICLFH
jgi:hypothetical protein